MEGGIGDDMGVLKQFAIIGQTHLSISTTGWFLPMLRKAASCAVGIRLFTFSNAFAALRPVWSCIHLNKGI